MMKLDRGNKDQSPHRKVRSNHDLDFRKLRLLMTSMILLIPAILFIIYWGNIAANKDWRINVFVVGSGLIILGCIVVMLYELINKDTKTMNMMGFLLLFSGGLLYLIASIGQAVYYSYHNNDNVVYEPSYDNVGGRGSNSPIDVKDGLYWFGIHCLLALDALVLAIDCMSDLYFAQWIRITSWAFPLLWTSWFAFGYWLKFAKRQLSWWQLCAKGGFGTIAIAMLLLIGLSCTRMLLKSLGTGLSFIAFLGSVLIWIYSGAIIDRYITNGHDASFFIGVPFLISAQTLFLLYDCLLGTKEPKDGAGAKAARPVGHQQQADIEAVTVPVESHA